MSNLQGTCPILQDSQADLLDIAQAARLPRLFSGTSEHREEDRRQDRDDGDHDQQLNERETMSLGHEIHHLQTCPPITC